MHIKVLDRYILKECFNAIIASTLFFSFIFLMFQLLRLAEFFIEHGVPLSQLMQITGYLLISFLPLGLPVAFLVGVLVVFNRFSSDSEIVAMKAGGYSLTRLCAPLIGVSVLVAIFSLALNLNWVPKAETSLRRLMIRVANSKFSNSIREGSFTTGLGNLLIYTEKANNQNGRMENVFMYDERNPQHPMAISAKSGETIRVVSGMDDIQGVVLQLQDGGVHISDSESSDYTRIKYDIYQIWVDIGAAGGAMMFKPKMYSLKQLLNLRNQEQIKSPRWLELDTELWRRVSVALAPLFFIWVGVGFGTSRTRGNRYGVLIVSFIVLAAYWQLQVSMIYLGGRGIMFPLLALEIPNILTLIFGVISFRRAAW